MLWWFIASIPWFIISTNWWRKWNNDGWILEGSNKYVKFKKKQTDKILIAEIWVSIVIFDIWFDLIQIDNSYDNWNSYFSNWNFCLSVFLSVCLLSVSGGLWLPAKILTQSPYFWFVFLDDKNTQQNNLRKGYFLGNNPSCTFRLQILFGWIQLHHRECWILNSRAGYILEVLRTLGTLRTLGRLFLNKHRKEVSLVRYDFLSQSVTRKSHHHQIIAKHFTWQLTWWLEWHSQPRERTITGLRLYEAQIWNNWTRYCRRLPSYLSKVGLLAFGSPGWSVFCSFVTMPKLPRLLLQTKIWLLNPSKWSRP